MRGIHRWPVNFPHKWPVTGKMFSFDNFIMKLTVKHGSWATTPTCMLTSYVFIIYYSWSRIISSPENCSIIRNGAQKNCNRPRWVNLCAAEAVILRENKVNIVAADPIGLTMISTNCGLSMSINDRTWIYSFTLLKIIEHNSLCSFQTITVCDCAPFYYRYWTKCNQSHWNTTF